MSDAKISALPSKPVPVGADIVPIVDSVGTTNKKTTLLDIQNGLHLATIEQSIINALIFG